MAKHLHQTTRPYAPRLNQNHGHKMRHGQTGAGKTALIVLLAKMMNLSVKELVQRYKLS